MPATVDEDDDMHKSLPTAVIAVVAGWAPSASALEQNLIERCDGCHGKDGVSERTEVPTIAGMSAFVHEGALYWYRDEERPCGEAVEYLQGERPAEDMCEAAAGLSDEQVEALAEHYAALPFVPADQPFDAAKADKGKKIHDRDCARCHTAGGSDPEDDAGILAGQWMGYLRDQFRYYAEGNREQPEKMKEKMDPLSETDTEALLHYYASQQ